MEYPLIRVALVAHRSSPVKAVNEVCWSKLQSLLTKPTLGEKDGFAWMPVDIELGARITDRVQNVHALVLDIERTKVGRVSPPSVDQIAAQIGQLGYNAIIHTTFSHSPYEPRYRLIFQLDRPLEKSELKPLGQQIAQQLGISDCYDRGALEPARLYYLPRCPEERLDDFRGVCLNGSPISVDDILREVSGTLSTSMFKNALDPARLFCTPPCVPGEEGSFKSFSNDGKKITEAGLTPPPARPRLTKLGASLIQFPQRPETPENIAHVKSQLRAISSDCERNMWRDIVWCVLSTGWNCAEALALEWSKTATERFEQQAFDRLVSSFDPEKASSLGTLHHYSASAGWTPDAAPLLPQSRFTFRTIDQLTALPPQEWRVKGLFPAAGIASIYGPSGCGKSFLALDLLAKIATGDQFYGHKTKACPVVYVALEGVSGITKRLQAYEKQHNIHIPDTFRVVTERLSLFNTDVGSFSEAIKQELLEGGVIVIDTLAQSAPQADENASADMGLIILNAQHLQHLTNTLVILVHHTGKDATKGARGHSSLMAALDGAIEVKKSVTGREWVVAKCKDDLDGVTHPFRLKQVNLGVDADGDPITSCVALSDIFRVNTPPAPQGKNQQAMLAAIKGKWPSGSLVPLTELTELAKTTLTCQRRELRGKEAAETLAELGHLTEQAGGYLVK